MNPYEPPKSDIEPPKPQRAYGLAGVALVAAVASVYFFSVGLDGKATALGIAAVVLGVLIPAWRERKWKD